MNDLTVRLDQLKRRLDTAYDGIGHSHGRPYVYFIYPPEQERAVFRLADDELRSTSSLTFYHLDALPIVMQSTSTSDQRRETLLNDTKKGKSAAASLLRVWANAVRQAIATCFETSPPAGRPVVVLRGLAALHPLGSPTGMMEALAEEEPRDPATGQIVPIVLLIPGVRPPQTSREYLFLDQERLAQTFYRGEEA